MGKRSPGHDARPRDFWPTPPEGIRPLLRLSDEVQPSKRFIEPCAGDGALVSGLEMNGWTCELALDLEPQVPGILKHDASMLSRREELRGIDDPLIVTNPPWARKLIEPLLDDWFTFAHQIWLLHPLDWLANQWMGRFNRHIDMIVPIGRVSWLQNGQAGKENSTWVRYTPRTVQDMVMARPVTSRRAPKKQIEMEFYEGLLD